MAKTIKFNLICDDKPVRTIEDLKNNNIDFHSFMSNSKESQNLFLYILDLAEEQVGFITDNYKVSIETSGCLPIEECTYKRSYKYVMDIKCPRSGVADKNIYENLLKLQTGDEVKYVVADRKDYDFMKSVMKKFPTGAKILVSPMFEKDNTMCKGCNHLVDWILKDNLDVRVQIQLHRILGCK